MPTVSPIELNSKELQEILGDLYRGELYIRFDKDLRLCTFVTDIGTVTIASGEFNLASVRLSAFTHNCGIISMTAPSAVHDKLKPLWLDCIEHIARLMHFSYIVGSDGSSNGWRVRDFIETHGSGWTVVPLNNNQRMSSVGARLHTLCLYYKYIDWSQPTKFRGNWITDAK